MSDWMAAHAEFVCFMVVVSLGAILFLMYDKRRTQAKLEQETLELSLLNQIASTLREIEGNLLACRSPVTKTALMAMFPTVRAIADALPLSKRVEVLKAFNASVAQVQL